MPVVSRPRTEIMALMARAKLPLIIYYIAARTAARLSEAMFVSMLFVAEMLAEDSKLAVSNDALSEVSIIAGYPASAFDLHTREGRRAIALIANDHPSIAAFCKKLSRSKRQLAVAHGLFIAEGGQLAAEVRSDAVDRVAWAAHSVELSFAGIEAPNHARWLQLLVEVIPEFNAVRESIINRC